MINLEKNNSNTTESLEQVVDIVVTEEIAKSTSYLKLGCYGVTAIQQQLGIPLLDADQIYQTQIWESWSHILYNGDKAKNPPKFSGVCVDKDLHMLDKKENHSKMLPYTFQIKVSKDLIK